MMDNEISLEAVTKKLESLKEQLANGAKNESEKVVVVPRADPREVVEQFDRKWMEIRRSMSSSSPRCEPFPCI